MSIRRNLFSPLLSTFVCRVRISGLLFFFFLAFLCLFMSLLS